MSEMKERKGFCLRRRGLELSRRYDSGVGMIIGRKIE